MAFDVGGLGEHDAPGVDDHRAAAGLQAGRVASDLICGHDEGLVLDGAGTQQDLPMVTGRGLGERRGDGEHACPVDREAAVELGEAQVVADGQTEL